MSELPMVPSEYEPIDIADNFGDMTLSCGYCRKPIYVEIGSKRRPTHCKLCGQKIKWKGGEIDGAEHRRIISVK